MEDCFTSAAGGAWQIEKFKRFHLSCPTSILQSYLPCFTPFIHFTALNFPFPVVWIFITPHFLLFILSISFYYSSLLYPFPLFFFSCLIESLKLISFCLHSFQPSLLPISAHLCSIYSSLSFLISFEHLSYIFCLVLPSAFVPVVTYYFKLCHLMSCICSYCKSKEKRIVLQ